LKDSRLEFPTVCVLMLTYNHKKYIADAIEGVLKQETDFPYELIIANDASTDSTDEIINKLIGNHPKGNLIKYFNHDSNMGMLPNFIFALNQGKGKYIAVCEGDDYWADPLKLQRQVDFLKTNEDYAICFHRVYELVEGKEPVLSNLNSSEKEETYTVEDLAKDNFIHTPSVVFRNGPIKELPTWFRDSPVGDYVLHMLNAKHGKIKYLPEPMAVYRRHSNGLWSQKSQLHQSTGWVWMLAHLANEFKNTDVEKILLNQKERIDLNIANFNKEAEIIKGAAKHHAFDRIKKILKRLIN
jgi:glycosyltransferase involved in cell wall biosynthesis